MMKLLCIIGITLFGATAEAQGSNTLEFTHPAISDPAPIAQNASVGETATAFPGQYYTDMAVGFGYNICLSGGGVAPCGASDWSLELVDESDYAVNQVPIASNAIQSSTATSGTTTTVLTDTSQNIAVNALIGETLCDGGTLASNCYPNGTGGKGTSQITANTATTITVSPAIPGMASGDKYMLMRRQGENRWEVGNLSGGRAPIYSWNIDKGRSIQAGVPHLLSNVIAIPTDPAFGLEFIPDIDAASGGAGNDDLANLSGNGFAGVLTLNRLSGATNDPALVINGNNSSLKMTAAGHSGQYWVGDSDGDYGDWTFVAYNNAGRGYNQLEWDPQSNYIKFGSTGQNPAFTFQGTGAFIVGGLVTGTNADFVCASSGGQLLIQASACTISSLRFKENVADLTSSVLSKLGSLVVASYNLKATDNRDPNAGTTQVGLIAENVAKVAPECAIFEDDMKTPKSYRQECVIALLVRGVQEQQAQISRGHWELYILGVACALLGLSCVLLTARSRARNS